jgi:branched-chain amino acid transport system substrate-binding protein
MKGKRMLVGLFISALLLIIPVIAFATGQQEPTAKEPIKIGLIEPLTGDVAYDGETAVNGAKLAVREVNEKGGLLGGRKIELIVEDGACVPAQSVSAAEKLITRDNVVALAGCFCSSSSGAVMPIAKKYGIPHVSGISTSPTLTEQGNEYFFRAAATSALLAKAFSNALYNQLNIRRIAYLAVNDDWGRNSIKAFGEGFEALGGKTVASEIFNRGETDHYSYLSKIKAADPDAIYVVANTANAARITNQIRELGIDAKIFGEGAWTSETYLELTGENSEGVYGITEYLHVADNNVNKRFVEEYKKAYDGSIPTKYAAPLYQVLHIIAEAIDRAGSDDPKAIRAALEQTNYQGLSGPLKFNEKHQAYGFNAFLALIKNGQPTQAVSATIEKP